MTAVETASKEEIKKLQLARLRNTVEYALKTPFYAERLGGIGITRKEDIQTLADLKKIPYTSKDDLRNAFPYGMLSIPLEEVVRLHASSGTTGTPTVIYHNQQDLDAWTALSARSILCTGARRSDVFQNMMTYGLFTGGLGLHYGAEAAGLLVIPASSGNTKRQFKLMKDFSTTIVHATPSYMLHLASKMESEGIDLSDLFLKKALVGAEPHSEDIRRKIEELFSIDVYNSYGLSEMNGPGVAFECVRKQGMHVWEDNYIMEIIDCDSLDPVDDGQYGELVLTTLCRQATPLLRYRTRDITAVYPDKCTCGRTHRRIQRITGRTDDMLIINGVNVFPSQIEEVIMSMPEIGTNYQIVVQKMGALDKLIVKTEVGKNIFTDDTRDLKALSSRIAENLKVSISINPTIELHEPGFLPVSEGKAVRVIDERPGI
ncbi:phenylacetate--CoA ligase [Marispirochaeta sp.]|jgi:phenylacetate-CoA ligase|uniref:phenylacetate--CoA ligase family protein n=1 Tax=Marispirochaeta sp. TaxID=2038653 RepID=UPI0029C93814|nr:phenylacetate--CoA ligase [Marispirochaeta sp.]